MQAKWEEMSRAKEEEVVEEAKPKKPREKAVKVTKKTGTKERNTKKKAPVEKPSAGKVNNRENSN